jgi:hypothetical protein
VYCRKTANGESYLRTWLVYSESSNKTFCICCKLFSSNQPKSCLASDSSCNWKHLHEYLRGHEHSPQHLKNYFQWFDMWKRLDAWNAIDQELQHAIVKERDYWKLVLYRLCSIVLYLYKNNLAFRGENDKLCTPNNGNFLGLVKLLSKYDVTMHEHVRRIISKETSKKSKIF